MHCRFYTGDDADKIGQWIARLIPGCERGFGPCVGMAVLDGENILGAVVFHNYSPECGVMEMSAAAQSPRWLNRSVLRAMHSYIFDAANCQLAVMRVSENNKRMLRIAQAFGYEAHRIPRLRGRNEAETILTLTEEQWRESKFKVT